jgi:site-specific DNA-methyltransferase (adenine-specific)
MKEIPDGTFDLLIADPPYGIDFNGKESMYHWRDPQEIIRGYVEVPEQEYRAWTLQWIKEATRVLKENASGYIISGWTHLEDVLAGIREANVELVNHVICQFPFGVFTSKKYVTSHYHVLYFRKNPKEFTWHGDHYALDVWQFNRNRAKGKRNANALPYELVQRMVTHASSEGDIVFDPFMGSGTTARVAAKNGRRYFGFDVNPEAVALARESCNIRVTGGLFK